MFKANFLMLWSHLISNHGLCERPGGACKRVDKYLDAIFGLIFGSDLCFDNHINTVTRTAFYHLKIISRTMKFLSQTDYEMHTSHSWV